MRTFLLSVTAMCIVVVAVGCQPAKKQAEPKDQKAQPAKTGSETKEKAAETLSLEPPASPVDKSTDDIKLPITPPETPAAETPEPAAKPAPVPNGSNGKAG